MLTSLLEQDDLSAEIVANQLTRIAIFVRIAMVTSD